MAPIEPDVPKGLVEMIKMAMIKIEKPNAKVRAQEDLSEYLKPIEVDALLCTLVNIALAKVMRDSALNLVYVKSTSNCLC